MLQPVNIFQEGQVLLINKPLRWTSFDVVNKIRHLIKVKKVGHAGTLDPLATGLLIICTGKFTKKINEYMAMEKEYTGTFTLGATTPTYDLESEPVYKDSFGENFRSVENISTEQIKNVTKKFVGEIMQVPPAHSAIKVEGKPVYKLARKGKDVKLEPRKIFIKEFEIVNANLPVVEFKVVCSTGTYIRSLANDLGEELGCGAYLGSLCRTRIGNFLLKDSLTIEEFQKKLEAIS